MKPVRMFVTGWCPHCHRAKNMIRELIEKEPRYGEIIIEVIDEEFEAAYANSFDYYYVPTFYVDGVKVHEGGIFPDEVEAILKMALQRS